MGAISGLSESGNASMSMGSAQRSIRRTMTRTDNPEKTHINGNLLYYKRGIKISETVHLFSKTSKSISITHIQKREFPKCKKTTIKVFQENIRAFSRSQR